MFRLHVTRHRLYKSQRSTKEAGLCFEQPLTATRLLRDSGYSCAIFGSTAFYLHGIKHQASVCIPTVIDFQVRYANALLQDLDILVPSSEEAETVNRRLVSQDPHFYLRKCKTRGRTYQI